MLLKAPCCGSDTNMKDWQDRIHLLLSPPALTYSFHFPALSAFTLADIFSMYFICDLRLSHVNWFAFILFLSVGNHLGAMVHQR